jgi:AdoMet-dependent heme synthase
MKRTDTFSGPAAFEEIDFDERPFLVIWEATQSCDLACVHCRASAQPARNPFELSTDEARRLIDDVAAMRVPLFVITGGDPLKRPDIYDLVQYAAQLGLRPSMTPSATPLLTRDAIVRLKESGLVRLAISLDGPTAETHDGFRRVKGSFDLTITGTRIAREIGLPVQINTTVTRHNLERLDDIIASLEQLDIALWSVFFLVPTGRGSDVDLISAEEFEQVFAKLYETSRRVKFDIKSTEAQHYRRYLLQRRTELRRGGIVDKLPSVLGTASSDEIGRAPEGINDGKGFAFVSHVGEVFPSGFLPLSAGNVRKSSLSVIYRESPLFTALRDINKLEGKCGRCEFKQICGGSRSRAFALTGNPFSEEPCCTYLPRAVSESPGNLPLGEFHAEAADAAEHGSRTPRASDSSEVSGNLLPTRKQRDSC